MTTVQDENTNEGSAAIPENLSEPTRLMPRPAYRPQVSVVEEKTFGRPVGVDGSFVTSRESLPHSGNRPQPVIAQPDLILKEAFARPIGSDELIGRDPLARYGIEDKPEISVDPWRDPSAGAILGAPALAAEAPLLPTVSAEKLGIREVLFGSRVRWQALAIIATVAGLVGVLGGFIGRITAEVAEPLFSDSVHLAEKAPGGKEPPRGVVVEVARGVEKAVVAIEIRTSDSGGNGSGVIIDKAGYIVTNNHVVSLAAQDATGKLTVVMFDGTRLPARIVGRDPKTDLAVVKIDKVNNLTVAALGNSDDLQIGEGVIAFGAPLGLEKTVTSGIVSALGRPVPLKPGEETDTDTVIDAIQTDASINPGNSGGALVNFDGKVVGINTAGITGSSGLNFAIPVNEMVEVSTELIKTGKAVHSEIGVTARTVTNDKVLGAGVANIEAGSPAAKAGLKEGDVITKFNGKEIISADMLTVAVRKSTPNKSISVTYVRNGRSFNATIIPVRD